jgi:hypothetical protein
VRVVQVLVHPNATAMYITHEIFPGPSQVPVTPTTSRMGVHVTVNLTHAPKKRASEEGSSVVETEQGPSGLPPKKHAMAVSFHPLNSVT